MNRRHFITSALAALAAPAVPVPVLKPRSLGASWLACWIVDPKTGMMKLYNYRVVSGEKIKILP